MKIYITKNLLKQRFLQKFSINNIKNVSTPSLARSVANIGRRLGQELTDIPIPKR